MLATAEESWRIALAAYREGGTDLLRMLEAQRTLMEVRRVFTQSGMESRIALAELETAVGVEGLAIDEALLNVGQ